jgi:2-succinyl-5-enolpyruvyl-6-hydroxy-3-cyclohexene-1-carboxylate synthase
VGRLTPNQALAVAVVDRLRTSGVQTFCVCPGGRNAPLVEALDGLPAGLATILSFFDERSAAFFALGRARRDGRPVAVVTTSGTAAAELLPAMVEAYYSSAPLVAVTADRPRLYRGSGAPQAIEQAGLFGAYAAPSVDIETPEDIPDTLIAGGPAHVNVCFAEPLLAGWEATPEPARAQVPERLPPSAPRIDAPNDDSASVEAFLADVRAPLVIVGGLADPDDRKRVASFCQAIDAPVMAEASSGLRCAGGLRLLRSGDAAARYGFEHHAVDSVLRIGDVPSWRTWRDLDAARPVPVLSMSRKPWRGLTRGTHMCVPAGMPLPLPTGRIVSADRNVQALIEWDSRLIDSTDRLIAALPASEPALVRRLSEAIPPGSSVYLGNSLPIREWNRFATFADRGFAIGESRGANGIDGQVSTFLGWARPGVENWAVLGDLTALYDLSALWALRHLDDLLLRIVVINNGGGRIFQRMFQNPRFQNRHATGFGAWAEMWGAEHYRQLPAGPVGRASVVELVPGGEETDEFWAALDAEARG